MPLSPLPTKSTRSRRRRRWLRAEWVRPVVCALLPLAAVALGGATARWSQGIILAALGATLLAVPPRASLGRGINTVLAALALLALTAFLPAHWFHMPAWRVALTSDFGTPLPATLSPQPWLAAESSVLFLAGMGWFYLMATAAWTGEERARAGKWFAGGVIVLAAVCVACFRLGVEPPIWHSAVHFGPFPNRNQTADFLAVGALIVLACAHLAWRNARRGEAAGWLAAWAVVAVALFHNFSRAGIGILFGGTAAYLANELFRARRRKPAAARADVVEGEGTTAGAGRWRALALASSLVLLLASGFMLFGGDTLQRMRPASTGSAVTAVTGEFRLRIQRDAVDMIADSPWCGVGISDFEPVFATYRRRSTNDMHIVHPESDWVWMAAELGWPAFVLMLAGCVLVARELWPQRSGTDRPLRTAAAVGVAAFVLHGFIDVSAHRVGTMFSALFVLGLALPGPREGGGSDFRVPSRWVAPVFRLLGLLVLLVGGVWLLAERGIVRVPGAQEVERLTALARIETAGRDDGLSEAYASQGLALDPLNWRLYFQRAGARLALGDRDAALADFHRARYLEPFFGSVPALEARLWAAAGEPDFAVNALLEACRRAPSDAPGFFADVCSSAGGDPAFVERLDAATRRDPRLQLMFLAQLPPAEQVPAVAGIVRADPELRRYDDAQRVTFFRLWARSDNGASLAAAMETHPAWQALGWRWWADACSRSGALDRACRLVADRTGRPVLPPETGGAEGLSPAELRLAAEQSPDDPAIALRLYRAQQAAGDKPAALATLHRITTRPGCPAYFHYLEGVLATETGRWPDAWEAWQQYLARDPASP